MRIKHLLHQSGLALAIACLTLFRDGANAGYQAMHYNKVEQTVDNTSVLQVRMVRNGGFAAVIE